MLVCGLNFLLAAQGWQFTMAGGLESTRQVNTASKEDSSLDVETVRWTVGESKKRQMLKFKL